MLEQRHMELFKIFRIPQMGQYVQELIEQNKLTEDQEELLVALLESELESKTNRRIQACIRGAHFQDLSAAVEDIIYTEERSISRNVIERYASCEWIINKEPLVLIGASGTGKSYIAQALGISACRNCMKVQYTRMQSLQNEFMALKDQDRQKFNQRIDDLSKVKLLIIDDFLTTVVERDFQEVLFTIFQQREHVGSTLVATQFYPVDWGSRMTDQTVSDQITNRLVWGGSRTVIQVGGLSMRQYMADLRGSGTLDRN